MKRALILLSALPLGACATMSPCYNLRTDNTTWQTGVIVPIGKAGEPKTKTSDYTCPSTIDGDLLDPPFPFPRGNG